LEDAVGHWKLVPPELYQELLTLFDK